MPRPTSGVVHLPGQGRRPARRRSASPSTRTSAPPRPSPSSTCADATPPCGPTGAPHRPHGHDARPFHFEVVEPFRQWRLRLTLDPDRARRGVRHHLARHEAPVFRQLGAGMIVGGRAVSPVAGYDGFGRQEGWVEAHGERFALAATPTSAPVTITGASATASAGPAATWGCSTRTAASGSSSRTSASGATTCSTTSATPASAAPRWPGACTACASSPRPTCSRAARSTWCSPTAAVKTMSFERLGNQIAFLRCGMYGGPNGGTPDGDLWHGMPVAPGGEVVVHGETFDVTDPDVRSRSGRAGPAPLPHHVRRRGDLRPRRALRHALLRGGQGRRHGVLAPRRGP